VLAGCGKTGGSATSFDGERAFASLKQQVEIGPRYSGTPGQKAMVEMMRSELGKSADEVVVQPFRVKLDGKTLNFTNVYGVFNPKAEKFVLLCAHWDTRPMADQEIDKAKATKPILGANDGASGVAVLLELARLFKADKPEVGVVMAFFDGEDYGPDDTRMFLGSKFFAKTIKTAVRPGGREIRYDYGILLDMVGDSDLRIPKERRSVAAAPKVVDKVWSTAKKMGQDKVFVDEVGYAVQDDHWPILAAGVDCVDVIDFDYAPWHTLDDTADKCSAKSLKSVGEVIAAVVYSESAEEK
jgi:Zn-dependent M28 family amino/carboxypeptidase